MRTISNANVFLILAGSTAAISLADLEPINGFSPSCTNAYSTPLTGCDASDFYTAGSTAQASCSDNCISAVEGMTQFLQNQCGGVSATPNTIIEAVLTGNGPATVCHNLAQASSPPSPPSENAAFRQGQAQVEADAAATSTTSETSTTESAAETSTTESTSETSTTETLAASTSDPTLTTPESFTPTSTTSMTTSITTPGSSITLPLIMISPAPTSTPTSKSSSGSTQNGSKTGSGGTILDFGSGSTAFSLHMPDCWTILAACLGSALLHEIL